MMKVLTCDCENFYFFCTCNHFQSYAYYTDLCIMYWIEVTILCRDAISRPLEDNFHFRSFLSATQEEMSFLNLEIHWLRIFASVSSKILKFESVNSVFSDIFNSLLITVNPAYCNKIQSCVCRYFLAAIIFSSSRYLFLSVLVVFNLSAFFSVYWK